MAYDTIRNLSLTVLATILAATFTGITASAAENVWTLKTDDTHLVLAVRENKLFIDELKNPAQGWNWTPKPSEVPLLAQVVVVNAPRPLTWSFREATAAVNGKPWSEYNKHKEAITLKGLTGQVAVTAQY